MEVWNSRDIIPPPWVTLPVEKSVAKNDIHKTTWELLQSTAKFFLTHNPYLDAESKFIKLILYKKINQMRHNKILTYIKQMNKCLIRLKDVDLLKIIHVIAEAWPSPDEVRIAATHVYLPSRQHIEYTMVRMVGIAHLLQQTANYALLVFEKALLQFRMGIIAHNNLAYCATASRIWFMCHSFRKHLNPLYEQLQVSSQKLQATKVEWLDTRNLPKSLIFGEIDEFTKLEATMKEKKSHVDKLLAKYDFIDKPADESSLKSCPEESEVVESVKGTTTPDEEDVGMALKISRKSEDLGVPIKRKVKKDAKKNREMENFVKEKTKSLSENDTAGLLEEILDVSGVASVYEEDDNYRQPVATSTPAANNPNFGVKSKSKQVPLLGDLTEINEDNEDSFDVSKDYNLKKLRLEIRKSKSIPKLLKLVKNNRNTIESKGEKLFQLCERKIRKFRKKATEEPDMKGKLLKRAKNMLTKELCLEFDPQSDAEPMDIKPKAPKKLFEVDSKKEIKLVISDASRTPVGVKKIAGKLLRNQGNFKVGGKLYQMSSDSLDKFSAFAKRFTMNKSSRANAPILVNQLVAILKRELIANIESKSNISKTKRKKKAEPHEQVTSKITE